MQSVLDMCFQSDICLISINASLEQPVKAFYRVSVSSMHDKFTCIQCNYYWIMLVASQMTWSIVALRTWLSLQIDAWLQKVFAGDSMPAYEVNEQTLDLLSELKHCSERQENYNQLIIHDMRLKADEYRAEGIVHTLFACCQSWKRCSVIFPVLFVDACHRYRISVARFVCELLRVPGIRLTTQTFCVEFPHISSVAR